MSKDKNSISCLILGKINIGKSSVLSTFLLDDEIVIGDESPTTQEVKNFEPKWSKKLYLQDSPGLEYSDDIQKFLEKSKNINVEPTHKEFEKFLDMNESTDKNDYKRDIETIKGIEKADVLLLIFDAEHSLSSGDEDLINTVSLWGKPFGIVLNKTEDKKKTDQTGHIVKIINRKPRKFDAHKGGLACFHDRKKLLKYLITVCDLDEKHDLSSKLNECKKELKLDWRNSFKVIARSIADTLEEFINHSRSYEESEEQEKVEKEFNEELKIIRMKVFEKIKNQSHHNKFKVTGPNMEELKAGDVKDWELKISWNSWKSPKLGPLYKQKKHCKRFSMQFLADSIAVFHKYVNHPHALRNNEEERLEKENTLKIGGFEVKDSKNHPCYWAEDDLRKLSKFCNSKGKNKKELVSVIKEKLLKSLEVTDEHLS